MTAPQEANETHVERSLVDRVRGGDMAAFEVVFRRYYEPLWRFVIGYVKSPEIARELVHDVFASVWERRATWVVDTSLRGYLYGAARNRALNALRRERQETQWEVAAGQVIASGEATDALCLGSAARQPDDAAIAGEEARALHAAVARLPERQRHALILRWFHGLSQSEVAEALGVSVGSAESLLVRALASLRSRLTLLR